ncbi:MAG: hypothetical protein NTY67_05940 [Cyanobacteria bacterium]|nr:hypothetical protein [Cyanobacteriota bacterium]
METKEGHALLHLNHSIDSSQLIAFSSIVNPVPLRVADAVLNVKGSVSVKRVDGKTVLVFSENLSISRLKGCM